MMEITSITPAIRIIKESNMTGYDMFIAFGDNIKIVDNENRIFKGIFLYMNIAQSEEDFDSIVLGIGNENIEIPCCDIKEMEEL